MSFTDAIGEKELAWISAHVMAREATPEEQAQLAAVADEVSPRIDQGGIDTLGERLRAARETSTRQALIESVTATVARAICLTELGPDGELAQGTTVWISANVTAASAHQDRCRAIWRHRADLGDAEHKALFEHALESALAGETKKPAPGDGETPDATTPPSDTGTTTPPPMTGKEDTMNNPAGIRDSVLSNFAFNPAGLPAALRNGDTQKVYVDAVVTATALLGHGAKDGDDVGNAVTWAAATTAKLLVAGHYNPQDHRFFAHVQKAVVELSGSAAEGSRINIDGHRIKDGQFMVSDKGTGEDITLTATVSGPDGSGSDNGEPVTMSAPDLHTQHIAIYAKAKQIISRRLGDGDKVFLQSWAAASDKAIDTYPDHGGETVLMTPTIDAGYSDDIAAGGGGGGGGGIANVDLPPLNDPSGYDDEIERENVRAVSTIYVGYQLEFAITACARVLELFVAGLLPIPASDGSARQLDTLYWDQEDFLDEASRRSIYARVLGAPGGELAFDIQPNTEFNTLLMRSVSAISEYEREQSALTHFDNAARGRRFQTTSGEFVRKAIRDFAANVSLRGWAGTAFTAERMAKQIRRVMKVLDLPAVKNAFGVTTAWQVIERVSQREFGITVNTVMHRTLAVETQAIMKVIADNHTVWSKTSGGSPLFSDINGTQGDLNLKDSRQLVVSAQHFRAVTGINDRMMNEYSEPVESYASPSLPDGGGLAGIAGPGGGGMPGVDMAGINELRNLVNSGQTPSPDQILSMLPRI